jgi:hypothetical protein
MFGKEDPAGCSGRVPSPRRTRAVSGDLKEETGWIATSVFLPLIASIFLATAVYAQDITATGGWTETIDTADLVSGAGSDLTDTYESGSAATTVGVTDSGNWRVDIKRTDSLWDADFTVSTRRTSDGSGSGSISGGGSYQEVTTTDVQFFAGSLDRSNITIQYRLTGMSVGAEPATYSTTMTFTVVSTL